MERRFLPNNRVGIPVFRCAAYGLRIPPSKRSGNVGRCREAIRIGRTIPNVMNIYRFAIDFTTQTIDRRARYYRNLIVVVTIIGIGSAVWALVLWSMKPLLGIFFMAPACGAFLVVDSRLLIQWRNQLLARWIAGELNFGGFSDALGAMSVLPKGTLQSMLGTLPLGDDPLKEFDVSPDTREAIAALVIAMQGGRADALTAKVFGISSAILTVLAVIYFGHWQGLAALLLVPAFPYYASILTRKRLQGARHQIDECRKRGGFDEGTFQNYLSRLDWRWFSEPEKGRWWNCGLSTSGD